MRILQMLSRSQKAVATEMRMNEYVFHRKFLWTTIVKKSDYEKKIKPYVLRHIEELQDELKFLDIYFKDNDVMRQSKWPNELAMRAETIRREQELRRKDEEDLIRWWNFRWHKGFSKEAREEKRANTRSLTRWSKGRKVAFLKNKNDGKKKCVSS